MAKADNPASTPEPFKRLEDLARKVVSVPKEQIEKTAQEQGMDKSGKRRRKRKA